MTRRRESPAALDLWDAFDDLRRYFERSFGGLEFPSVSGRLDWPTDPAIDLIEGDDEILVLAQLEMPGVTREGLEIKVDGNTISIDGKRSDEVPTAKYLIRERRHEDYHKGFTIDENVDREGISADIVDGVLTLRLKVREAAKPRKISVG